MAIERSLIMTEREAADVFAEWERRYREDPDGFSTAEERLGEETDIEQEGADAAGYFFDLVDEMGWSDDGD